MASHSTQQDVYRKQEEKQYQRRRPKMKRYVVVMLNNAFEQVEIAIVKGFDDAFKYGQFMMNAKEDEYRDFFLKALN
nr:MAG: hypothetical protein [Bacteriophage sp.]